MTKAQAQGYMRRYRAMNRFEREELRRETPEVKFRQICALFFSADQMGWTKDLTAEDAAGHASWSQMQRAYLER